MGMMGRVLGLGGTAREVGAAVGDVAEVFVGNRAERDAAEEARLATALDQFGAEFARAAGGAPFDRFVNAMNRLPRPLMTIGTLGLFAYAMVEPAGFGLRMQGLDLVPEPLWWLLGAIVSFYFGARELHYQRARSVLGRAAEPVGRVVARTAAALPRAGAPAETDSPAPPVPAPPAAEPAAQLALAFAAPLPGPGHPDHNPAIDEWRRQRG